MPSLEAANVGHCHRHDRRRVRKLARHRRVDVLTVQELVGHKTITIAPPTAAEAPSLSRNGSPTALLVLTGVAVLAHARRRRS